MWGTFEGYSCPLRFFVFSSFLSLTTTKSSSSFSMLGATLEASERCSLSMSTIQLMNGEPGMKIETTESVLVLTRRNIPSKPVRSNPNRLKRIWNLRLIKDALFIKNIQRINLRVVEILPLDDGVGSTSKDSDQCGYCNKNAKNRFWNFLDYCISWIKMK